MRPSDFRYFIALFFLPSLMAEDAGLSPGVSPRFRSTAFRHDVPLRDTSLFPTSPLIIQARGGYSLPPGGQELDLQPTGVTPYDRYFGSVRAVISNLEPHPTTMVTACHLMKVGYSFDYISRDPYRPDPPKLTEAQHAGDCKSKALWLYDNLADAGALFAIGKSEKSSRTSHAWVYWRNGGRWWILDCTDRTDPIAADSVSPDRYVPYYSFGKSGVFRHQATRLNFAQNTVIGITAPVGTFAPERKKTR